MLIRCSPEGRITNSGSGTSAEYRYLESSSSVKSSGLWIPTSTSLAKAAAAYADFLVITSDNPRDEDPNAIIQDILAGLEGSTIPYEVVVDRKEAILRGMQIAQPGDVLVLAGKGHEDYQVLPNNVHIHMDEREIVADCLTKL